MARYTFERLMRGPLKSRGSWKMGDVERRIGTREKNDH